MGHVVAFVCYRFGWSSDYFDGGHVFVQFWCRLKRIIVIVISMAEHVHCFLSGTMTSSACDPWICYYFAEWSSSREFILFMNAHQWFNWILSFSHSLWLSLSPSAWSHTTDSFSLRFHWNTIDKLAQLNKNTIPIQSTNPNVNNGVYDGDKRFIIEIYLNLRRERLLVGDSI